MCVQHVHLKYEIGIRKKYYNSSDLIKILIQKNGNYNQNANE